MYHMSFLFFFVLLFLFLYHVNSFLAVLLGTLFFFSSYSSSLRDWITRSLNIPCGSVSGLQHINNDYRESYIADTPKGHLPGPTTRIWAQKHVFLTPQTPKTLQNREKNTCFLTPIYGFGSRV